MIEHMETKKPIDHREILALWPSIPEVSRDVKFNYVAVWRWKERNYIPPEWWSILVSVAHERDLEVSYKLLAETVRGRRT